ncbi:MAG: cytochrome c550 [Paenisporosarcina sp.]
MQKNPIVPFILIFAFGIGLIFFLSIHGVEKKAEIAEGGHEEGKAGEEKAAEGGDFDPEAVAQGKCISCHGGDLTGAAGPSLVGTKLSADEIKEVLAKGKGIMPPNLVEEANLDAMAEYILTLK